MEERESGNGRGGCETGLVGAECKRSRPTPPPSVQLHELPGERRLLCRPSAPLLFIVGVERLLIQGPYRLLTQSWLIIPAPPPGNKGESQGQVQDPTK